MPARRSALQRFRQCAGGLLVGTFFYTVGMTWLLLTAGFSNDAHLRSDVLIGVTFVVVARLISGLIRP